jgi:hypothetical protein
VRKYLPRWLGMASAIAYTRIEHCHTPLWRY